MADHEVRGEIIFQSCKDISGKNLRKLENTDFIKWFSSVWADMLKLNGLGFAPVISDFEHNYLTKNLIDILGKHEKDAQQIQGHLSTLISSDRPDLNWKELLEFLGLIKRYKSLPKIKNSKELENHIRKYNWINFGYIGPVWTKKDFIERAKKILSSDESVSKQFLQHKNHFNEIKKKQKEIEKLLNLNKQEKFLFEAARSFMFCKAFRLNVRHKFQYISELIFAEICRRYKLDINGLRYATRQEILDFLSNKAVSMDKIVSRRVGMVEITENGKKQVSTLKSSKKLLEQIILEEKYEDSNEVKGQAAFLGKVKGKVKIVFDTNDMNKVQKGDILFAITTTPDLLPAMDRAVAFVTDQGGITSHAAIVAREMKKPCVIGTKVGTKIFKDGDLVEVDANNGIVKLLSQESK